jgi:hypothetical protein
VLCSCLGAQVSITPDLVYSFGPQAHHLYSLLAGTFYAPVVSWVYTTPGDPYYAWDALTAVCWMKPNLCKVGGSRPVRPTSKGNGLQLLQVHCLVIKQLLRLVAWRHAWGGLWQRPVFGGLTSCGLVWACS